MIDKDFVEKNFSDLFEGLGTFEKPYKILIKENAKPISHASHRVPHAIREKLKEKLNDLVKKKIIVKADGFTEWAHNIVIRHKKDKTLRVCLDPGELNENIIDENFLIPTLDELTAKLKSVRFFSVLDLKDGFWHVKLDAQSQNLCTFATPFGNYKFLRMPFGIKSGPKVFQRKNNEIFGDIENIFIYMDDILILGKTREEHDKALLTVLERARQNKVKFNKDKMKIAVNEVKYLGHVFSEDKITPDSDRIEAIKQMGEPRDKTDLQKFLGVVNYVRQFIVNLAEITAPLRELLKKNVVFNWTATHSEAIKKIKEAIVNAPILVPFDETKDIQIQSDASKHGLGCCILQDGKPISFASRTLTDAECRYSQIEKEFLSILFACKKFRFYTYGRKIKIVNDHKPLTSIIKKEIHKIASARLQNMRIKLWNFDIQLEYAPGKTIHIADYLSRYSMKAVEEDIDKNLSEAVLVINVSDERKKEFQEEIEKDLILKKIKEYCLNDWPSNKAKCDENTKFFFKHRNEIFLDDDILFLNDRIMVPMAMKRKMLSQLHESHFGIVKTKKRAKKALYWANMDSDIENMINACETCQLNAPKNQKEPLISHSIPDKPFVKLACDIFEFKCKDYLVVVDYYSKWIELKQLTGKKAINVNQALAEVFSRNGIPKVIIADNMPFDSYECRAFAKSLDFEFETSSPHYPKSNGLAERGVQICKNILRKTNNIIDVYLALLEYRTTPTKDLNYSPSQLNQNRMLRSKLPMKTSHFNPQLNENIQKELENKQNNNKKYYDRSAKARREFSLDESVYVWINDKWQKGKISKIWHTPRSYIVQTNDGEYRRNSRDLRVHNPSGDIVISRSFPQEATPMPKRTRSGREY